MVNYKVDVYNDMGHLMTEPYCTELPKHIFELITINTMCHLNYATDLSGIGCTFYILKPGVETEWTVKVGDDTLTVKYNLEEFDETSMKWKYKVDDTPIVYHSTIVYSSSRLEIN